MLKKLIRDKEFFSKKNIEPIPKDAPLLFEIHEKDKEIERLNNIIDELENILNLMIYQGYDEKPKEYTLATVFMATGENSEFGVRAKYILNRIKQLKGEEK